MEDKRAGAKERTNAAYSRKIYLYSGENLEMNWVWAFYQQISGLNRVLILIILLVLTRRRNQSEGEISHEDKRWELVGCAAVCVHFFNRLNKGSVIT